MGETVLFFTVCKVKGVFYRVHMKYNITKKYTQVHFFYGNFSTLSYNLVRGYTMSANMFGGI